MQDAAQLVQLQRPSAASPLSCPAGQQPFNLSLRTPGYLPAPRTPAPSTGTRVHMRAHMLNLLRLAGVFCVHAPCEAALEGTVP